MASSDNEEHELNSNHNEEEENNEEHQEEQEAENEASNEMSSHMIEEEQEEQEDQEEEQEHGEQEAEGNDEDEETAEKQEEEEEAEEAEAEEGDDDANNEKKPDNDSDEEFEGFGEDEINVSGKKSKNRHILSDDDDNEGDENGSDTEKINLKKSNKHKSKRVKVQNDSDDDQEENDSTSKENEDEEVEEKEENEEPADDDIQAAQSSKRSHSDSDKDSQQDSEEGHVKKKRPEKESDLEKMLKKNQAEKRRKNRRKNVDSEELNEMDNKISMIISEMKNVAAEDRAANEKSLTTLQKIKMLPNVINMLQKSEYHATMIELGVLGAIAEWLAPLPDRSLPNISIRDQLIDALRDFGEINVDYLKSSGVGKAVMFLYKHSKETKSNKQKLEKLINNWARPIFNLDSNFKQLTKEERQERDMEHIKSLSKRSSNEFTQGQSVDELLDSSYNKRKKPKNDSTSKATAETDSKKVLRPGDPGFIPRARVPIPSSKDYIIRPKSNIEAIEGMSEKKIKKTESRLDKHKKRFIEIKRNAKSNRAVTMVAAGGK